MKFTVQELVFRSTQAVLLLILGTTSTNSLAQEEQPDGSDGIEEIIVSVPFDDRVAETILPITVLSGDALLEEVNNTLGTTLKKQIGINSASFGTAVGQPVVRGQTARRVMVLQNSVGVTDVAAVSPDHVNSAEAILAERLEVIRGPSTLLYGSGAVGGVVNVIDNRIPESLAGDTEFIVQQTRDTVNAENKTIVRLDTSSGNLAFHLDAFSRSNEDFKISGFAIDELAVERLEGLIEEHLEEDEHHEEDHHHDDEDDHDDHGDHDEEEIVNTNGFIGNSNAESHGGTAGFSWVGDNGFIGFSVNDLSNNYGLPPGAHEHHDHHEEEHEEEHHDEDEHHDDDDDHGGHEEVEFIRLDLKSRRYDLRGGIEFNTGWIESVRGSMGFTDYEHSEVEFFEDGDTHVGTFFTNEGAEGRFTLTHIPFGNWTGVWGLQTSDTEFSATGEESFIPRSDITSRGLFGVERYNSGNLTAEVGLRFEQNSVDPHGGCSTDVDATSLSGSVLYDIAPSSNVLFGLSRSERAPAVEELYSNTSVESCARFADDEDLVVHASSNLLEIGNPDLSREISNNIEIGYRKFRGAVSGSISAYYNQIDNFIFLELSGEQREGIQIANYFAKDAEFRGIEGEIAFALLEGDNTSINLRLFGDIVDAEFDDGGNVPRIPAAKLGAELQLLGPSWNLHFDFTNVRDQNNAGEFELPTAGYTNVSLYADYRWQFGNESDLRVFIRGNNLLDEEMRNHASFLKNFAPEPGRGFMVGLRLDY